MYTSQNIVEISLLGEFSLAIDTRHHPLPSGARRLLALLGLRASGIERSTAEELFWPDASKSRAAANLRGAIWRVRRGRSATILCSHGSRLYLSPHVSVDLQT